MNPSELIDSVKHAIFDIGQLPINDLDDVAKDETRE